jgi:ParB/RepB/Spo0J family partition protein
LRTTIPLNTIAVSAANVRKTGAATGIDELAASIKAHGLINPILVVPATKEVSKGKGKKKTTSLQVVKGRYDVIAGQRRVLALRQIHGEDSAVLVEAVVADVPEAKARELSLAENLTQLPMNAVDQLEAFSAIGEPPAVLAQHFGVTERYVKQRLALANLVPDVLAMVRTDVLDLAQAAALTLASREFQQNVFLPAVRKGEFWTHDGGRIKQQIHSQGISAEHAMFDRALYKGDMIRDLFSAETGEELFANAAEFWELQRAAVEKLAAEIREAGVYRNAVIIEPGITFDRYSYRSAEGNGVVDQARVNELAAQINALETEAREIEEGPGDGNGNLTDEEGKRLEAIEEELEQLRINLEKAEEGEVTDEVLKTFDVYLVMRRSGRVERHNGLISYREGRERDDAERERQREAAIAGDGDEPTKGDEDEEEAYQPIAGAQPTKAEDDDPDVLNVDQKTQMAVALSGGIQRSVMYGFRTCLELVVFGFLGGSMANGYTREIQVAFTSGGLYMDEARKEIAKSLGLTDVNYRFGQEKALELYRRIKALSDEDLHRAFCVLTASSVGCHISPYFGPVIREIALDQDLAPRDLWSPDKAWLNIYTKAQLGKLFKRLTGADIVVSKFSKTDLVDTVAGRMTLSWLPKGVGFDLGERKSRLPNGVEGESAEPASGGVDLPPLDSEHLEEAAIAAE